MFEDKELALEILETIKNRWDNNCKDLTTTQGLCINFLYAFYKYGTMEMYNSFHDRVIKPLFDSWEHNSGDSSYPVPSARNAPKHNGTAENAYNESDNLFNLTTEYGQLRYDLLLHCIKELKNA